MSSLRAVSLFSGAGGMDVGFRNAGYDICIANEIEPIFCKTYEAFFGKNSILCGDIDENLDKLASFNGIDVVFGGPPCQGFSVAGKMDPNDTRSKLIFSFLKAVALLKPKVFVMENVRALGHLEKWAPVRKRFLDEANELGYNTIYKVLNSADYGIPQKRERVFFIGVNGSDACIEDFTLELEKHKAAPRTVREVFSDFGRIGTDSNPDTCTAFVTLAANPVMRKSPYAGMLLNGQGRPVNLDSVSMTLPASMGGNKTPVIDQAALDDSSVENWAETYHRQIVSGELSPEFAWAPERLRRMSITEAAAIQTFPPNYPFQGSKGKVYCQIGNAVPCKLAETVATVVAKQFLGV